MRRGLQVSKIDGDIIRDGLGPGSLHESTHRVLPDASTGSASAWELIQPYLSRAGSLTSELSIQRTQETRYKRAVKLEPANLEAVLRAAC